jgi:RNA polymerase sigma factor (sigma-70 family)
VRIALGMPRVVRMPMPSPSVALLRTQSDERLAALAAAGHERAFEAIVERYRRSLIRHAESHLSDARAEDAVQQALLSAWTGLRRGDDVRDLRAWLHRIVHNASLNALRVAGYDHEELRETLEGGSGAAEAAERRAVVRGTLSGLAALPERQREALLQIAVQGRSQDEVAEGLGLSQGAVRQLVHRARTALRAAATAALPLPLATWLASAGGGGATVVKAGAVAVIAGGAIAAPAIVRQPEERAPRTAVAEMERPRAPAPASSPGATPTPARDDEGRGVPDGGVEGDDGRGGGDEERSGRRGGDEREGDDRSGRRGDEEHEDRSGTGGGEPDDRSGSGGGDEPDDRSGSGGGDEPDDRSGPGDGDERAETADSSGPGDGDEDGLVPLPEPAGDDSSGSGSGDEG